MMMMMMVSFLRQFEGKSQEEKNSFTHDKSWAIN